MKWPLRCLLMGALAGPFLIPVSQASYSDPYGVSELNLVQGSQLISIPFQKAKSFQGEITSVTGATLTFDSLPTLPPVCYVQVYNGSAKGEVMTILSSDSVSLTMESSISGLSIGDIVQIREHITLGDITDFVAAEQLDKVILFNHDGTFILAEYYDGFGWFDLYNEIGADNQPVFPGEGLLIQAVSSRTVTMQGVVSTNQINFNYPGNQVLTLLGCTDPVAGEEIGSLFDDVASLSLLALYSNVNGNLTPTLIAEYYVGYGWFDLINEVNADAESIGAGSVGVLKSATSGTLIHPPAYIP